MRADEFDEETAAGRVEVPDFGPTRHELIQLVKYWTQVYAMIEVASVVTGQCDCDPMIGYSGSRIGAVRERLGDDLVEAAKQETWEEIASRDPDLWKEYLRAAEAAQEAPAEPLVGSALIEDDTLF